MGALRAYEVMFITDPNLEVDQHEAILDRLTRVVAERGGSVANVDRWGKRRLAYEIAGHREGNYTVMSFQADPSVGVELERVMRITDGIIRYLIVKQEDV